MVRTSRPWPYADGAAESLLGEAMGDRRDEHFLVSKALPQNTSRQRLAAACEASLRRLGTDRLDPYLLHWRGSVPLAKTVESVAEKAAGPRGGDVMRLSRGEGRHADRDGEVDQLRAENRKLKLALSAVLQPD